MTPQELEELFGPSAPPSTPAAPSPTPGPLTGQQVPTSATAQTSGQPTMSGQELFGGGGPTAAAGPQALAMPVEPGLASTVPSVASRIASDIGTGITELPRAITKGARDAVQESASFVRDASGWQAKVLDPVFNLFGGDATPDAPKLTELPDLDAPKSVTGKLATSVSQFITGMVGLGKLAKPLEIAGGLAKAGRAAKIGVEAGKAATVGATAFDPSGPRMADLVESVPGLQNPITGYLKADPSDTRALGRVKNALESIGMDAVLIGGIMAGTRAFKTLQDLKAGKATQAEVDEALRAAEAHEANPAPAPSTSEVPGEKAGVAPGEPPASSVVPEALPAQVPELGSPKAPRDVMDLSAIPEAPRRDVLDLTAPKGEPSGNPVAVAGDGVVSPASAPQRMEVSPEQTKGLLTAMREDADALTKAGSWDGAVAEGHTFGRGERVPWQKLVVEDGPNGDGLSAFVARLTDELKAPLNAARGGDANGVLSDARVMEMVRDSSKLFADDPALITGRLAMAGDASRNLAVDLEVSYLASTKALQDSYALASRIHAGDLTEFAGNGEAAAEALRQTLATASTFLGYGQAIRAGSARTMRRMRAEFGPKLEDIEAMRGLSPEALVQAVVATAGDPRSIAKLTQRSALKKMQDAFEFSYVNGLLWGPRSHFVNFVTNAYMVAARPLERMVGDVILNGDTSGRVFRQGVQEYAYIGSSLGNAWKMAAETWQRGDSMLSPHNLEALTVPRINPAELRFKTPDSLPAVLHNTLTALVKVTGFPTRALGTVDEFVQQVVYRSKVQANAHIEGIDQGLADDALTAHVRDKLHAAYDGELKATDSVALNEARTATFQQDLLPGTMGHTIASAAVKHQIVRLVLPFVRTPTNVLRYGQKLTPGLNLLQQEYRQMLTGKMGAEAHAQAVGQMSMGSLFLGTAAFLASSGTITGAGPSDAKLRAALLSTGWQPYSFVKVNADGGKTYVNFGRYDPVGLPFGIVADIVDALSNADDERGPSHYISEALTGAALGLAKQLTNKSYLKSLNDALEAATDPDASGEKFIGQIAANTIPWSSALRFVNPDDHLRDARSIADKMLATVPGLSATLPARRDMWGDPITVHKGLWVTIDADLVDAEVRRMVLEGGNSPGAPSYNVGGVDLRDVTMVNGRNAYDYYQDLAAKPSRNGPSLKQTVAKIIKTPGYQRAPDGDAGTRGTKMAMLAGTFSRYRNAAGQRLRADANVRAAMAEKQKAVTAAYAKSRAPVSNQRQAEGGLVDIGRRFGVDLDGLVPKAD